MSFTCHQKIPRHLARTYSRKKKCRCFCNHGTREGNVIVAGVEAEDDDIVGKELSRHLYILENSDWELSREMEAVLKKVSEVSKLVEGGGREGSRLTPDHTDIFLRQLVDHCKEGVCFVPLARVMGYSRKRILVETYKHELSAPAREVQNILVEQLKFSTTEVPLPWSRQICIAMSKQLKHSKMVKLFDDFRGLQKIYDLNLGGVTASKPDLPSPGDKRSSSSAWFPDSDGDDSDLEGVSHPVDVEIRRWDDLAESDLSKYRGSDKIMNLYSFFSEHRTSFPLLFALFRQTAPGITHEANVERVNSAAQGLFDPNLDANTLSRYVYIVRNVPVYGMDLQAVRERYIKKYGGMLLPPVCTNPAHCHFAIVGLCLLCMFVLFLTLLL